jgi:hypothetical protein
VDAPLTASRGGIALAAVSALAAVIAVAGCGSGYSNPAAGLAGGGLVARATPADCPEAVLEAFGDIAVRVYREGVSSERTVVARRMIGRSNALRKAVERGDAPAARSAAERLIATGHLTNLIVSRTGSAAARPGSVSATASRVLVDVGAPGAVAPVHGTLTGASGAPIGSFITSVWSDSGIRAETNGIAEGVTALRERGRSVGGSFALPSGELPAQGTLVSGGISYQYTSFPAEAYPSGSLRVFVLKPLSSIATLCGATNQDTVFNTLQRVARRIYTAEAGRRTLAQIRRVERNGALLSAVARRSPAASRAAIKRLLNQHIVRLRVSAGGRLLADVGGPFVLAPVHGSLRLGGRTIGSFVLSIQDDEGYLRLAKRLAGLDVLMYMGPRLVKNSLGPSPGPVPSAGYYHYRGRTFRVFSFNATAFPSGPLRIVVLAPIAEA